MSRKQEWWSVPMPHRTWSLDQLYAYEELHHELPLPYRYWLRLLQQQGVRVSGNRVWLQLFPAESSSFLPEVGELEVSYEDEFCLVVNKPPEMSVHPQELTGTGSLANLVTYYYMTTNQFCAIRHIHRLDQDTTGAVLYAKNEYAHILLDQAMREKHIKRSYVALVQGTVKPNEGTITQPIGRDRHHAYKRRVSSHGDAATTHYRVIERCRSASLVQLELDTGRTHQIRVHLSHIGHPIVGDSLYGGSTEYMNRQALHAEQLKFQHPLTLEHISIHIAWPMDMRNAWTSLKLH